MKILLILGIKAVLVLVCAWFAWDSYQYSNRSAARTVGKKLLNGD